MKRFLKGEEHCIRLSAWGNFLYFLGDSAPVFLLFVARAQCQDVGFIDCVELSFYVSFKCILSWLFFLSFFQPLFETLVQV